MLRVAVVFTRSKGAQTRCFPDTSGQYRTRGTSGRLQESLGMPIRSVPPSFIPRDPTTKRNVSVVHSPASRGSFPNTINLPASLTAMSPTFWNRHRFSNYVVLSPTLPQLSHQGASGLYEQRFATLGAAAKVQETAFLVKTGYYLTVGTQLRRLRDIGIHIICRKIHAPVQCFACEWNLRTCPAPD